MMGLSKKENYLKSDEQRVAVIKHVLNTSTTDSQPLTWCLLSSTDTVLHWLLVLNPHKGAHSVFVPGFS